MFDQIQPQFNKETNSNSVYRQKIDALISPKLSQDGKNYFQASSYTPKSGYGVSLQKLSKEQLQCIVNGNFTKQTQSKDQETFFNNQEVIPEASQNKENESNEIELIRDLKAYQNIRSFQPSTYEATNLQNSNKSIAQNQATIQLQQYYQAENNKLKLDLKEASKQFNEMKYQSEIEIQSLKSELSKLKDLHEMKNNKKQRKSQEEINQKDLLNLESFYAQLKSKQYLKTEKQYQTEFQNQLMLSGNLQRDSYKSQREQFNQKNYYQESLKMLNQENRENKMLSMQVDQLQIENQKLVEHLQSAETQNNQANQEIQQLKKCIQESQQDVNQKIENLQNEMKLQKEKDQKMIKQLKYQNYLLKNQNNKSSEEVDNLRQLIDQFQSENDQKRKSIQQKCRQVPKAKTQIGQNQKTIQIVQKQKINRVQRNQRSPTRKQNGPIKRGVSNSNVQLQTSNVNFRRSNSMDQNNAILQENFFPSTISPKTNTIDQEIFKQGFSSQQDFFEFQEPSEDISILISQAEEQLNCKNDLYKHLLQQSQKSNTDISQIRRNIERINSEMEIISNLIQALKRKQLIQLNILQ